MRISDVVVEKLLKQTGRFSDAEIDSLRQQEISGTPLQDIVVQNRLLDEAELTRMYADEVALPFVELTPQHLNMTALKLIPERVAREYNAIVFNVDNGTKHVAITDPDNVQAIEFLKRLIGPDIKTHLATTKALRASLDQYRSGTNTGLAKIVMPSTVHPANEHSLPQVLSEDSPVAASLHRIIEHGIALGAETIHMEPRENQLIVRYRVDGRLRVGNQIPKKYISSLIEQLKYLCNLPTNTGRAALKGNFSVTHNDQSYTLLVSFVPVIDGDKAVLRILQDSKNFESLSSLGLWGQALQELHHAVVQPKGLILMSGPIDSGVSTTVNSLIASIATANVDITSIEESITQRLPSCNQIEVDQLNGMSYASAAHAALDQHPNVLMLRDLPDKETVDTALQAALSHHLVIGRLYAPSVASSLQRILDMHIEGFLLAGATRVVVSQRLVRRLCPTCRQAYSPDPTAQKRLARQFRFDEYGGLKHIHELENLYANEKPNHIAAQGISTTPKQISRLYKASPEGCKNCSYLGYKGRIGLYEVLANTDPVERQLVKEKISFAILEQTLRKTEMLSIRLDGFIKALAGETSVEELLRLV